jgi:hypothetical protein
MALKKILITLFLASCFAFVSAQESIELAAQKLEKALVQKDTLALKNLLHDDLGYGHSNGWVENKHEIIENLLTGKMQYKTIQSGSPEWKQTGDMVTIRMKSQIEFIVNGKEGKLDLFVLQVWKKEGNEWKLLARQSTKLN